MKKTGFTLIEMIVVLVLMGIVIVLVLPAVRTLTYNSDTKKYQQLVRTVNEAAKLYSNSYQGDLVNTNYECFNIPYSTLINEGLIEEEDIKCSGNIIMRKREKVGYDYEQYLTCENNKGEIIHDEKRPSSLFKCIGFSGKFVVDYELYSDNNYSNIYTEGNWDKYVYAKYNSESPYGVGIEKYQYTKDLINWIDMNGNSQSYTNFDGNIYIRAIDQDGNISSMIHHLIKADTTGPVYSLENNENGITDNNMMLVSVANLSDNGVGVDEVDSIYSFDNGISWVKKNSNEYELASTGIVQVKDKLGNVTTQPVSIVKACSGNRATATSDKILTGYSAWVNGNLINGTMKNNETINKVLSAGDSYKIPQGYHNGNGNITAKTLKEQTQATATADNISDGLTAWVNGVLVTGNGTDVKSAYDKGIIDGKTSAAVKKIVITFNVVSAWQGTSTGSGDYTITIENNNGTWTTPSLWFNHGGTSNTMTIKSVEVFYE